MKEYHVCPFHGVEVKRPIGDGWLRCIAGKCKFSRKG